MKRRKIVFAKTDWDDMRAHVQRCAPEEACGLVGGQGSQASLILPVTNELHSPTRYRMLPEEQLQAMLLLEERGLEMLGVYHSHPAGQALPSQTDLEEFYYPGVMMIIWCGAGDAWDVRGFEIRQKQTFPVVLTVEG